MQNIIGNTALHFAASNGLDDICNILMEFGANGQIINKYGNIPNQNISISDYQLSPFHDDHLIWTKYNKRHSSE